MNAASNTPTGGACIGVLGFGRRPARHETGEATGAKPTTPLRDPSGQPSPDLEARFWSKVCRDDRTGCWLWTAAVNSSGTPVFAVRKKWIVAASRVARWITGGELESGPAGKSRTCGESSCVNPDHFGVVPTLVERWEARVDRDGPAHPYVAELGNCWVWTGHRLPGGYGTLGSKDGMAYAHRLALQFATGQEPKLFVLHSCDRPWCVNPAHLREGTQAENVADREARNRGNRGNRSKVVTP